MGLFYSNHLGFKEVFEKAVAEVEAVDEQGASPAAVEEMLDALIRGHLPPGIEALAPFLQPALETVFDFLPSDTLVVLDDPDPGRERLTQYCDEALGHYRRVRDETGAFVETLPGSVIDGKET